ncbi:MAG: EAL domain-containing protein [Desulfopila sp.]
MTLYRQLLTYSCAVLVFLSICLGIGELTRIRQFVGDQLESHAQDAATSLGLSLSTISDGKDIPTMEAMVNSLFDRGYYSLIQLRDVGDQLLIDRQSTMLIEGVPAWFIHLLPLDPPRAEALIMHGWQQVGTITVESHPGYAYQTLWRSAVTATISFAATFLVVALLGGWGLRRLLKPLAGIEEQAVALTERRFHIQNEVPRTRELCRVVTVMNRMTVRLRDIFHDQAAMVNELMQRAYQDPVTGLGNRRFVEAQVKAKVTAKGEDVQGSFLLIQLQKLQDINHVEGYDAGDELLRQTAEILRQATDSIAEPVVARLGGGDFALLLPNIGGNEAQSVGNTVLELHRQTANGGSQPLLCGGTVYRTPLTMQALLTTADQGLIAARHRPDGSAVLAAAESSTDSAAGGRLEWKTLLQRVIADRAVVLYSQPTVRVDNIEKIIHHEILSRVVDATGAHLSLGRYIPYAEQFGLMPALDRLVLERLAEVGFQSLSPQRIAVNLSVFSLEDRDFMRWLDSWLAQCVAVGVALNFEFTEYQAVRHRTAIADFAAQIRREGHKIGIDHFGQGLIHFGYLNSLLPDYVKIDRAITQDLWNEENDSTFFVKALCNAAHSLAIGVMVEGVESEEQWQAVSRIQLDAVQGFLIQRPTPLKP